MMEVMDCDLHRVIQSKQPLSEKHHKCFIKQMLEGIKAMHAIGVFHRDLKPGNILVSKDCQLRITDFGLARFMDDSTRTGNNELNPMTEYVVTRWYRSPELLLAPNRPYSEAIDLWSIGCILAELLRRKPLFPGKSHANQVQLIFEVMGYSDSSELGFPISQEAATFLDKKCRYRKQPMTIVLPGASDAAVKMVESLIKLNPDDRPTAAEALADSFLSDAEVMHDYSKNYLTRPTPEFFDFEKEKYTLDALREMIHDEVRQSSATAYREEGPNTSRSVSSNDQSPRTDKSARVVDESALRKADRIPNTSRRLSNANDDTGDGPASQMPTHVRNNTRTDGQSNVSNNAPRNLTNAKADNPFRTKSSQKASVQPNVSDSAMVVEESGNEAAKNVAAASAAIDALLVESHDAVAVKALSSNGNILTAVRNAPGPDGTWGTKARKTPKTPSPKKMEAIIQKDLSNKRRFLMQQQGMPAVSENPGDEIAHAYGVLPGSDYRGIGYEEGGSKHLSFPAGGAQAYGAVGMTANSSIRGGNDQASNRYSTPITAAEMELLDAQRKDGRKAAYAKAAHPFPILSATNSERRLDSSSSNGALPAAKQGNGLMSSIQNTYQTITGRMARKSMGSLNNQGNSQGVVDRRTADSVGSLIRGSASVDNNDSSVRSTNSTGSTTYATRSTAMQNSGSNIIKNDHDFVRG